MSIEEVSVLFDTGRKGDAKAAALHFSHGKDGVDEEQTSVAEDNNDIEKQPKSKTFTHVE